MAKAKAGAGGEVLTAAALNRALLARQLLLARAPLAPTAALGRLVALQAQLARPPHLALWSRLAGFERAALAGAVRAKAVVRATTLRGTLHLLTAEDYLAFRGTLQPVLDKGLTGIAGRRGGPPPDVAGLVAEARARFATPSDFEAVRQALLALHPDADDRLMGFAVRMKLPLVQVPTDAPWGFPASADFQTAEAWLGRAPDDVDRLSALVRRYLAAFGPATPQDMQTWSGLGGLKPAFEALRPELATFRDARGRELFDLPDAPRPDPATPAPVRLLPDFDAAVMGHDDRSRILPDAHRPRIFLKNLRVLATFLVDGMVAGTWRIDATKTKALLTLSPFEALPKAASEALEAEAAAMVRFAEPAVKTHAVAYEGR